MRIGTVALAASLLTCVPAFAQQQGLDVPGRDAGPPSTSDRTPQKNTKTPLPQVTSEDGKTSDRTPSNNESQVNQGNQGQANQGSSQSAANDGRPRAMSPAKLKTTLESAGFKNVVVVDAAYLVHATNSDGDTIIMTINPPSMAGATTQSSSGQRQGSSSTGSSSGASGSSGAEMRGNPEYNSERARPNE